MKTLFGAVILAGLVVTSGAGAETCPPTHASVLRPTVVLSTGIAPAIYSNDLDRAHITALAGRDAAHSGRFNTGLTRNRTEVKIVPHLWLVDLGRGRHCVGLGRVEAEWKISSVLVDIASEYRPGGCNYRVILQHEDEHVAFAHQSYRTWTPRIEATLRDAVARVKPSIASGNPRQIAYAVTARLMQALQPAFDGFRAELRSENASIDTPANYRLVNGRCPKW